MNKDEVPFRPVVVTEVREGVVEQMVPIVVDMGKVRRGKAKQIARGKGPVTQDLARAVRFARAGFDPAERVVIVPLVVVYEKKRKKRKRRGAGCFPS